MRSSGPLFPPDPGPWGQVQGVSKPARKGGHALTIVVLQPLQSGWRWMGYVPLGSGPKSVE